jgi:hypothetical protein
MIALLFTLFAVGMPAMLQSIPAPRDLFHEDEQYVSPEGIFDLADDQLVTKSPEVYSPTINYLRALGLKIVMAYYDFTTWISIQSALMIASIQGLFASEKNTESTTAFAGLSGAAGDSHDCCT